MALSMNSPRKFRRIWQYPRDSRDEFSSHHPMGRPTKPAPIQDSLSPRARLPQWTQHAEQRAIQRNLPDEALEVVLLYGETLHRAGAVIYFLRRRDVMSDDAARSSSGRWIGATVILDSTQQRVLTVYRNRRGLRRLKRKPDRDMRRSA